MKNNHKFGKFGAKGYYIALVLCAAAIGICGYLYYRNANNQNPQLQDPTSDVGVISPSDDIPAVGTQPGQNDSQLKDPDVTNPKDEPQSQPLQVRSPLEGNTVSDYAVDCLAYNETTRDWRVHDGIDIAAEAGSTVCAAADGTVYTTYSDDSMGMTVVIRHAQGYVTVYSSLSEDILVSSGDTVTMGQAIGKVGNTAMVESAIGNHLHFSVSLNDESIDPKTFLKID
jgi:murein DD-endopeptidase MepM/ murein hydrolase activator NlpD